MTGPAITSNLQELTQDLEMLKERLPDMLDETIHEIGNYGYASAQSRVAVKSGNLRLRSGCDNSKRFMSTIFYNAPYAPHVENGTGIYGPSGAPFVIEAKSKKALRWTDAGGIAHFAKRVTIQGMPPRPFLRPGVEDAKLHAEEISGAVFDRYMKEAMGR